MGSKTSDCLWGITCVLALKNCNKYKDDHLEERWKDVVVFISE